jgi:cysteine desulfurase
MREIYLDSAATTKIDKSVLEAMEPYFTKNFGNASSIHGQGRIALMAIEESREVIAKKLGAKPEEIYFTSGGTESNNWAIKGFAFANKNKGRHIITSAIEHDCVLNSCKWLEKQGFRVTYLPVDKYGLVYPEDLEKAIQKDTILVSVMHANNEVGTIEPIEELAKICHDNNIYFHTDACQSFTKVPLDVEKQKLDLVTINAHKIYGPKGVGALYIRKGIKIEPWLHGGGHEKGFRSGTENVPGIVGFAKATEVTTALDIEQMENLRAILIKGSLEIPNSFLNGHPKLRLCNNANISFRFIEGESLVLRLDAKGIEASTGSACSSHSLEPSHVLLAMGLSPIDAHSSLRLTLGRNTTRDEIDYTLEVLNHEVENLRKISPFGDKSPFGGKGGKYV